jgi:hypothetical protein
MFITILRIYWKVKLKEKFVIYTKKTQMLIRENKRSVHLWKISNVADYTLKGPFLKRAQLHEVTVSVTSLVRETTEYFPII